MSTTTSTTDRLRTRDNPDLRPLLLFSAVAVPTGWVLLSAYQLLGLPGWPFVLLTLALGLLVPTVVLVRRDPTTDGRQLLRDCLRLPSRPLLLVPAVAAIPGLTWAGARLAGAETDVDTALLVGLAFEVVSSVVILNLWEELAWTGFAQRRAMARWGLVRGSLATAVLFAAIHLPMAFDGAGGTRQVLTTVAALLAAGVGLRLLVAGFDVWSARSLLTIAVLHASFNAAEKLVDADHDWVRYAVTVLLGLLVLTTPVAKAYGQPAGSEEPDKNAVSR
jgi:membrane protease YdiL (CAAX protease family)